MKMWPKLKKANVAVHQHHTECDRGTLLHDEKLDIDYAVKAR